MEILIFVICIFIKCILICEAGIIRSIYFDPNTTVTSSKQDGVVVIELENKTISTICITNGNDNNNAQVICRMMNYTGGPDTRGLSIISAKTSKIGDTLFQTLACKGDELTIENCPSFTMSSNQFMCKNHNQDLHVNCLGTYVFDPTTFTISNCNGNLTEQSQGLVAVTENSVTAYFCNINSNFGSLEAFYLCKNTLCTNAMYARISMNYPLGVRQIGGFNNMSCNTTACINVNPYQSDRCTPTSNIALTCTNDTKIAFPSPSINCSSSSVTVSWDSNVYNATIANNFFAFQYNNGSNCTSLSVNASVTSTVNLTTNFGTCDMIVSGNQTSIFFIFRVTRLYPKPNNVFIFPDETFNISCVIARNQTVVQGPLVVLPVGLPPTSGSTIIPNTLTLYTDGSFQNKISNISFVSPGTKIFALVQMVNPPPNIILVLTQCTYGQVNLISNRCPVDTSVQISPINSTTQSFSFTVTPPATGNPSTQLSCITTKCSTAETGCPTTC